MRRLQILLRAGSQCDTMKIKIFGHMSYKNVLLQGVHETNAVVESQELLGVIISEVFPIFQPHGGASKLAPPPLWSPLHVCDELVHDSLGLV